MNWSLYPRSTLIGSWRSVKLGWDGSRTPILYRFGGRSAIVAHPIKFHLVELMGCAVAPWCLQCTYRTSADLADVHR